jgi:hypothetical protein
MASTYSALAFQQRINILLILHSIARLQRTFTVWAYTKCAIGIAILATISFFGMYLAAGKNEHCSGVNHANVETRISGNGSVRNR